MLKTIFEPVDCEVHSIIRFLNAKNIQPAQFVEIYGEHVMTDEMAKKMLR